MAERAGEEGVREGGSRREGGEDKLALVVDVQPLVRQVGDGAGGRGAGAGAEFGVARGEEESRDGEEGDGENAAGGESGAYDPDGLDELEAAAVGHS